MHLQCIDVSSILTVSTNFFRRVAQLVLEFLSDTQKVVGSCPTSPTIGDVAQLVVAKD